MPFNDTPSTQLPLSNYEAQLAHYLSQHKSCMSQPQLQGFLYAISCCPNSHIGNSWQRQVLPKEQPQKQHQDCSHDQLVDILRDLFRQVQQQVLALAYQLPANCIPEVNPTINFNTSSQFHQWSLGFMDGYLLIYELWHSYLAEESQQELNTAIFILGFFANRSIAEDVCHENSLGDFTNLCLQLLAKIPEAIETINQFSLDLHSAIQATNEAAYTTSMGT